MARCDQGYLCRVCGEEVEHITDSVLYLRYIIGEIDPEVLHLAPESHLQCTPTLAQFVEDERIGALPLVDGPFAIVSLDPEYAAQRCALVTRGYRRLWDIRNHRAKPLAVRDYPLAEVVERWRT